MSTLFRSRASSSALASACFAALVAAACSSDPVDNQADGGGTVTPDGGTTADGAPKADAGPVGPTCGRLTTPCKAGEKCDGPLDCADKICRAGVCQAPAPADGIKNGDETDIDCGGSKAPACADGKGCALASDCTSSVCTGKICQAPTPTDGVKNGDETGTDCGGTKAPKCATGEGCLADTDCNNVKCDLTAKKCLGPLHTDGLKNGDETGVDCGGPNAPLRCPTGQGCLTDPDCNAVLCDVGGTNLCKPPAYDDGLKNGDETGVDCGGPNAPLRCPTGQGCLTDPDCDNVRCDTTGKVCKAPSHTDGLKNGDETGVDCGGPTAPNRCAVDQGCVATSDCNNVACDVGGTNLCLPPSSSDGLKNGTETDVDCGGGAPTNAPGCAATKNCTVHADCASNGCNYANKCAEAPSCAPHLGGDTCGRGEVGAAGAVHESCCASQLLPSGTARVDKYEITAGRMREFIKRTGGNVQGWVAANRPATAQISDTMVPYLPLSNTTPTKSITHCDEAGQNCATNSRGFGVLDHLGNTVFFEDRPCPNCGQGCWIGTVASGGYGHPTYWWDNATQTGQWSSQPRKFSQADLDVKSLNCVTQVLLAAFCAWDGGHLATTAELGSVNGAWGPATYPWGSNTYKDTLAGAPGRTAYFYSASNFLVPAANTNGTSNLANAVAYNYANWNPFSPALPHFRYMYPTVAAATWDQTDQAFAIAAPGRMYNDFRQVGPGADDGYHDIAANLIEAGGDYTGSFDDANHMGFPRANWTGGSFEGHDPGRSGYNLNVLTKYGKMGGRCARNP